MVFHLKRRKLEFKLPIIKKEMKIILDNQSQVETVVCLSQQKPDDHIEIEINLDEIDATSAETKATYHEYVE